MDEAMKQSNQKMALDGSSPLRARSNGAYRNDAAPAGGGRGDGAGRKTGRSAFSRKRNSNRTASRISGGDVLRRVNRVLAIVSVILTIAVPLWVWQDARAVEQVLQVIERPQEMPAAAQSDAPVSGEGNVSYASLSASRNFFRADKQAPAEAGGSAVDAVQAPGLAQRYSLLGVLRGETPQAIVRENLSNSSMFLSRGQRLGNYQVAEILADRVILEQNGERFELKM